MPALPTLPAGTKQRTMAECDAIITFKGGPFEIVEKEINGKVQKVWKNQPPTYRSWLVPVMTQWKDRIFISAAAPEPQSKDVRERVTYGDALERAFQIAAWLRHKGIKMGDHVAIGGTNSVGWIVTWIATHLIGAVPVLLNSTLQPEPQLHCLKISHPVIILCDQALAARLAPHRKALDKINVGPIFCWSSVSHLDAAARAVVGEIGDAQCPDDVLKGVKEGKGLEGLGPESVCNILFTSGTTGNPKAVISTQRAALHTVVSGGVVPLRAALRAGLSLQEAAGMAVTHQQSALVPTPFFHTTGCHATLLSHIMKGNKVVLMRYWSVPDAIKIIVDEGVTITGGVPAIVTSLINSPLLPKSVQFEALSYGGAPPPKRLAKDLNTRWPAAGLVHGFGMTEMNGAHVGIVGQDYIDRPGAVGHALPIGAIKIIDPETGKEMPQGQMGLIVAQGNNIMTRYYGNEEATKQAFRFDGWLDTGDLGLVDKDGFMYILDRAKDIIIRGGENIACAEVENAIYLDDRVADAAAVPVPHPVMGEVVGVCVQLKDGVTATGDELVKAAEGRLRHPARPQIIFVSQEALPRNANGKVLKNEVKKTVGDAWAKHPNNPVNKAKL